MGKKTKIQIINMKYTNFVIFLTIITALLLSSLFYLTIQIPNSYANNNVIKIINQKTIRESKQLQAFDRNT